MASSRDIFLTAVAPAVWGSTYLVTTELLPPDHPLMMATLRALPAGLLLLLILRKLPPVAWIGRIAILGALNFSIFWALLFVAAYRLPGGVAATVGAVQPLIVILLASLLLGRAITGLSVGAAVLGALGVALLVLGPEAALNPIGIAAGLGGAASMAAGTVLSRRWQPPVPPLTFAAWQLTAGGLLLLPVALAAEGALPPLSAANLIGISYLAVVGGALTYLLWFRGVARLEPVAVSTLGFLSPLSAIVLGWSVLGESLDAVQITGAVMVLMSVALGQRAAGGRSRLPVSSTFLRLAPVRLAGRAAAAPRLKIAPIGVGVRPVWWTLSEAGRRVSECRERDPLTRLSSASRSSRWPIPGGAWRIWRGSSNRARTRSDHGLRRPIWPKAEPADRRRFV